MRITITSSDQITVDASADDTQALCYLGAALNAARLAGVPDVADLSAAVASVIDQRGKNGLLNLAKGEVDTKLRAHYQ